MSYRKSLHRTEDQPMPLSSIAQCAAYDCPMPGVYGAIGTRVSFCRLHDEMPAHLWPAISERARRQSDELHAALKLCNESPKNSAPYGKLLQEIRKDFEAWGNR